MTQRHRSRAFEGSAEQSRQKEALEASPQSWLASCVYVVGAIVARWRILVAFEALWTAPQLDAFRRLGGPHGGLGGICGEDSGIRRARSLVGRGHKDSTGEGGQASLLT